MQMKYTEEKLNTFSKETLIQLFLTQQEQLSEIDGKLQLVLEQLRRMLSAVLGDDDAADIQPDGAEGVDQAHDVHVIGDAEIAAALVELDMLGADGNDDLCLVL